MTSPDSTDEATEGLDPGIVRAGAAAAARRRELDISQRRLAADRVINAGALIAFEKGRAWPRERTRAKLEEVLGWAPGTIARLRRGEPPAAEHRDFPPPASVDQVALVAQAVITAVHTFGPAIESLPAIEDADFIPRVSQILADLRQLETVTAQAGRVGRVSPLLIKALSAVRSHYDELMVRAAEASGATLGQRLYAARRAANLTIRETAEAAGVSEDDIEHSESEEPVSAAAVAAIESLINQLD